MLVANGAVAFLAGGLSILSPCVLPILPVVFGAAAASHRWAPIALIGGLVASFTGIGLFVATIGFSLGLDSDGFQAAGAVALIGFGAVLLAPPLERAFARGIEAITSAVARKTRSYMPTGAWGHGVLGIALGVVWAPCTGPTLGAASLLAAQGRNLPQVALTMLAFGLGASVPLVLFGLLSRIAARRWRASAGAMAKFAKAGLGVLAVAIGLAILTGFEHRIESALVQASPRWLVQLTTKY